MRYKIEWTEGARATLRLTADRYALGEIINEIKSKCVNLKDAKLVINGPANRKWVKVYIQNDEYRAIFDIGEKTAMITIVAVGAWRWKYTDKLLNDEVESFVKRHG